MLTSPYHVFVLLCAWKWFPRWVVPSPSQNYGKADQPVVPWVLLLALLEDRIGICCSCIHCHLLHFFIFFFWFRGLKGLPEGNFRLWGKEEENWIERFFYGRNLEYFVFPWPKISNNTREGCSVRQHQRNQLSKEQPGYLFPGKWLPRKNFHIVVRAGHRLCFQ